MFRNSLHGVLFFLSLLVFPVCASAQGNIVNGDDSMQVTASADEYSDTQDRFSGFQLGVDLLLGAGRCDDKMCTYHDDEYNSENTQFLFNGGIKLGYLWGKEVLVGPELNAHYNQPWYAGGDLRVKTLIPMNSYSGITASIGFGFQYHGIISECPYYIPIQVGYDFVKSNGFVIGISLETQIAFSEETDYKPNGKEDKTVKPVLGFAGGGLHLGYIF